MIFILLLAGISTKRSMLDVQLLKPGIIIVPGWKTFNSLALRTHYGRHQPGSSARCDKSCWQQWQYWA